MTKVDLVAELRNFGRSERVDGRQTRFDNFGRYTLEDDMVTWFEFQVPAINAPQMQAVVLTTRTKNEPFRIVRNDDAIELKVLR